MTDNDEYTAAYAYSADGLRLRAQESNHAHPDRFFLYDGVRPTAEGTLSGDTWTTTERYVWEGDGYYDPLVYLVYDNARYYPLFDGLGSTRQLTDEDEDVTDTYSYEAFGNLMSSSGSTVNPYKYVGSLGYYQTGSSLMHLGARYYMPEIGRFASQDPERWAQDPSSQFTYCGSNPTRSADPSGRQPPSFDNGWAWEQVFGPQNDPYFVHFPAYAWDEAKAWTKCYADCINPVKELCKAAAEAAAEATFPKLARFGGWAAYKEIGRYMSGVDAFRCTVRCSTDARQKFRSQSWVQVLNPLN